MKLFKNVEFNVEDKEVSGRSKVFDDAKINQLSLEMIQKQRCWVPYLFKKYSLVLKKEFTTIT